MKKIETDQEELEEYKRARKITKLLVSLEGRITVLESNVDRILRHLGGK